MTRGHTRAWRWIALAAVVANVAFNYLSMTVLRFGVHPATLTDRYGPLFHLAPYAFSIWGLIYGGFVAYAVYALYPWQREVTLHDRLSIPLTVANLLASAWIVAFQNNFVGSSMVIMLMIVGTAIVLYVRSRDASLTARSYAPTSRLVGAPFSLFLGWISVAAIANTALYVKYIGLDANQPLAALWAASLLVVAFLIGLGVASRYRDFIVPAVVSWASFAVWAATRNESGTVMVFAFVVGVASGLVSLFYLVRSSIAAYHRHREDERRSVAIVLLGRSTRMR